MDVRKLKALRDLGVAEYSETKDGGVFVRFADTMPHVHSSSAQEEAGDLELPPGVIDPRKLIADINKRRKVA